MLEHILGLQNHEGVYPLGRGLATDGTYELGKVFRGQAQLVGIEPHIPFGVMILFHKLYEAVEYPLGPQRTARRGDHAVGKVLLPAGAQEMEYRRQQAIDGIFDFRSL